MAALTAEADGACSLRGLDATASSSQLPGEEPSQIGDRLRGWY